MIRYKKQLLLTSIVILLPALIGTCIWNLMPEQMMTHWGINGETDGWSGKGFTVYGLPLIMLLFHWLGIWITIRDPKNNQQNDKVFQVILWIIPTISLMVCGISYGIALGNKINICMVVYIFLGVLFLVLGNYFPKCKQNNTIGIKVTWTLKNEENWYKTHRFTGKLWVFAGILLLATMSISNEKMMAVLFGFTVFIGIAPMIYSYVYYRRQLKAGTVTKDMVQLSPAEKKTTKIALMVGIGAVVFSLLILFVGDFKINYGETSFTVDAFLWEDVRIDYEEIKDITYREKDDLKASQSRVYGYGSIHLLMGNFENEEFGTYIRYSYTGCDSCVVINVGDKTLVLNGKNEEKTREIYDELQKRMKTGTSTEQ